MGSAESTAIEKADAPAACRIEERKDGDRHFNIHFIWLFPTADAASKHALALPDRQATWLQAWTDKKAWDRVHLWYDSKTVTTAQIAATRDRFPCVSFHDAWEVPAWKSMMTTAPHVLATIPLYFRVDFLKLQLQHMVLRQGSAGHIHVVCDIDVTPRSARKVFNPWVIDRLRKFGVLFVNKEGDNDPCAIENGWCVACPAADMHAAKRTVALQFTAAATDLSLRRLEKSTSVWSVGGCVYQSIVVALTWLVSEHADTAMSLVSGDDDSLLLALPVERGGDGTDSYNWLYNVSLEAHDRTATTAGKAFDMSQFEVRIWDDRTMQMVPVPEDMTKEELLEVVEVSVPVVVTYAAMPMSVVPMMFMACFGSTQGDYDA